MNMARFDLHRIGIVAAGFLCGSLTALGFLH
jgi:hypothetical protein